MMPCIKAKSCSCAELEKVFLVLRFLIPPPPRHFFYVSFLIKSIVGQLSLPILAAYLRLLAKCGHNQTLFDTWNKFASSTIARSNDTTLSQSFQSILYTCAQLGNAGLPIGEQVWPNPSISSPCSALTPFPRISPMLSVLNRYTKP